MFKGVIAAGDKETVAAGVQILKMGGNAVDAAVAASFASFVAEPMITNIGGGGIALIADGKTNFATVLDFFCNMPSNIIDESKDFREIIADYGPEKVPYNIGRASVAVPGTVAGLCEMVKRYGSITLDAIIQPAIELARRGIVLKSPHDYVLDFLRPIFFDTIESAAIYSPGGKLWELGERIYFPDLAFTLGKLAQEGPSLFYRGEIGRIIVEDQKDNGGLITIKDLVYYKVREYAPIRVTYRGYSVLLPPPASIGGILIAFALRIMDKFDVSGLRHNQFAHIRFFAELLRITNLARSSWQSSKGTDSERISSFLDENMISSCQEDLISALAGGQAQKEFNFPPGPKNTTHISVVDGNGLAVSLTTSTGEGAGFVLGDTGVFMNNMLGEADLHPTGFHKISPGERLTTMMSPTIVLQDGEPKIVIGSGGSSRLRGAIKQVLSNIIDFNLPLSNAVKASRVHYEDSVLQIEGGIEQSVINQLKQFGYKVNIWHKPNMFFGGTHAIASFNGKMVAVGDSRRGGVGEVVS